jgi:hypothetical protein
MKLVKKGDIIESAEIGATTWSKATRQANFRIVSEVELDSALTVNQRPYCLAKAHVDRSQCLSIGGESFI